MLKKGLLLFVGVLIFVLLFSTAAFAAPKAGNKVNGDSITEGTVYYVSGHYLEGQPIEPGYDAYGYNYQAHLFKGYYVNAELGSLGYPPYKGNEAAYLAENPLARYLACWRYRRYHIEMKWNDAWLSNKDRDMDGKLDRHYGMDSYIGSGAWECYKEYLYNTQGDVIYQLETKIVAVPSDAVRVANVWCAADGTLIGPVIWDEFAIIQETKNGTDTFASPLRTGLGGWQDK